MMRATTIASSEARWWLNFGRFRWFDTMSSLKRFSSGHSAWESASVSRNTGVKRMLCRLAVALMKPTSKWALCAMIGLSPTKSMNILSASSSSGAPCTSLERMPVSSVMSAGMGICGSTKVLNSRMISPPEKITAPISVIRSFAALRPVVSISKATNSVSSGSLLLPMTALLPSMSLRK